MTSASAIHSQNRTTACTRFPLYVPSLDMEQRTHGRHAQSHRVILHASMAARHDKRSDDFTDVLNRHSLMRQKGKGKRTGGINNHILIAFTFRWDALWMEYCTSYNYVWSTAFALSALLIIFNSSRIRIPVLKWAAIPFCFVAAAMHEACGFLLPSE